MATLLADVQAEHHYVPKFYLKGFTGRNGVLSVHERHKPPRASKPKDEANRENYYWSGPRF